MTLHLDPTQLNIVKAILQKHIPDMPVWAFGSRVSGTHRQYSDLDLAICGEEKISLSTLIDLKEAFSQSDLDIKIDIIDMQDIHHDFKKNIEQQHISLQN